MRKNVASQVICAQLNSKTDGSAVTSGTTTVYVTGDGGTQSSGGGTVTHEGQGCWSYVPTQAETNYNHVAYTFTNSTAISQTVQVYPVSYDPTDAVRLGLTALPNAAAAANGGLATADANNAVKVQSGTGANQISLSSGLVTIGTNNDKTGYGLSSAAVQAIWDALTSALTTVGSIGKLLVDNINATISSRLAGASYTAPLDAAATRSAVGLASANLDTQLDALPTAAENADAVWDETLSGHLGAGSTGNALNAAGSSGDPWATALPGAYGSGTAGKILGDNLNATVGSRATQTSVDTLAGYVDTEVAAIKAKTDNLPADPADASDIAASFVDYVDTEIAAIKAKTDLIPASPAATGDIPSAATVADAVWDEARSGHVSAGTFGAGVLLANDVRLKKNTPFDNFPFLMVDGTDFVTPETGLTVTAQRSIDGGAFGACTNSPSEVGSGVYKINLSAADLNGDSVTLKFTATGAAQRTITVVTQP